MLEGQSIESISSKIKSHELKSEDVVKFFLDKIKQYNKDLNAIVSLRDETEIISEAKEKDRSIDNGNEIGLLHGMPLAIKDITDVKELPTSFGCKEYKNNFPDEDSIISERLKKEGAIIIGKTNTAELAYGSQTSNRLFGSTHNPYDITKTAGGSSGGAAAAVSSGMLPLADGTDMMGSVRNPAAYCNLYGFRPTPGLIPEKRTEVSDIKYPLLSTLGGIARTPDELSIFLDAVSGRDERDPFSFDLGNTFVNASMSKEDFNEIKIGWLSNLNGDYKFENGILEMCNSSLNTLMTNPFHISIDEVNTNLFSQDLWSIWKLIRSKISYEDIKMMDHLNMDDLCDSARWEHDQGREVADHQVDQAINNIKKYHSIINELFEKYDFLAIPSAQVFPFDINNNFPEKIGSYRLNTYHKWMEVSIIASLFQLPTLSVPVGLNNSGLPMGMQIIGKKASDLKVMSFGKKYESIFNHSKVKPPKYN